MISKIRAFILDFLFPLECLGCKNEGAWLCQKCFRNLKFGEAGSRKMIDSSKIPALDGIFIAGDYDDALLAELIKKFKYHFITAIGKSLADFLILYWSGQTALSEIKSGNEKSENQEREKLLIISKNPLIIPIPLSKKRLRWRGFNQAEILAREFAAHFSYQLNSGLKRIKNTRAQASLSATEREKNISGVFAYDHDNEYSHNNSHNKNGSGDSTPSAGDISGRTIILIDDVATTGATLNEAALVLRAQGAAQIYGLVLAKG